VKKVSWFMVSFVNRPTSSTPSKPFNNTKSFSHG